MKTLGLEIQNPDRSFKSNYQLDIVRYRIPMDMAEFFLKLSPVMGETIPFTCTVVGANISESFCERELHLVNQVMTKTRTSLSDYKLEKLSVLKMNECFMRTMRSTYPR